MPKYRSSFSALVRFFDVFSFSLRLIFAKRAQYFLVFLGIFLGVTSLFFFFSLTEGLKTGVLSVIEADMSETTITVKYIPKSSLFQTKLTETLRAKILRIEGIQSVARELPVSIPATASVTYAGFTFPTDTFVKGADPEFFLDVLPNPDDFRVKEGSPIPLVISPLIIDIFNVGIADAVPGISRIEASKIIGITADLTFGKYVFLTPLSKTKNIQKKGIIVATSQRASPIGISLPIEEAFSLLKEFDSFSVETAEYSKFLIFLKSPTVYFSVKKELEAMGLDLSYEEAQKERVENTTASLLLLQAIFLFSSVVILFVSGLFLFAMMSISVLEHRKTIGILRAIGASKTEVMEIFLMEGVLVSAVSAFVGVLSGWALCVITNKFFLARLPSFSFLPENIFSFRLEIPIFIFFGVVIFTIIASFFPARRAAKLNPLEAILE